MAQLLPLYPNVVDRLLRRATSRAESTGRVDLSPSVSLLTRLQSGEIKKPTTLKELIHIQTLTYSVSAAAAVELGFPLGSLKVDGSTSVFIQDFAQYRELIEGHQRVLIGVAIRYGIAFRKLDGKLNLNSLAMIAAAAQLNLAETSAKFDVMGMSSPQISDLVPALPQLDVDAYVKYSAALQAIKRLMGAPDTYIEPMVLAVYADTH